MAVCKELLPEVEEFLSAAPVQMFIGGQWVEGEAGKTFQTLDPGDGSVLATVAQGGSGDIDRAVQAAQEAFGRKEWAGLSVKDRAALMRRLADLVDEHQAILSQLESLDVGKPLAQLLLMENATATIVHSKTRDLPAVSRRADIVFAAVGQPEMVRGDWIKPGATVIDVGINRVPAADGKSKLVGDIAFAEASQVAGAITPVPGGVGPMTIACLMLNTLKAACAQNGLDAPSVSAS